MVWILIRFTADFDFDYGCSLGISCIYGIDIFFEFVMFDVNISGLCSSVVKCLA